MMETINITKTNSRFLLTLKKYIMENRRSQLMGIGAFLGFSIIMGAWCGFLHIAMNRGLAAFYMFFAMIFCLACTSLMFSDMGNKEGKIRLLMTPASASDVFFSRLLFAVPVVLLISCIGYLLMGYVNILIYYLRFDMWVTLPMVSFPDSNESWSMAFMTFDWFLFNEALFILGAVLWPRLSFIKTIAAYAIMNIVFSVLTIILKDFIAWVALEIMRYGIEYEVIYTLLSLFMALSIAIIWFAYYRYKRVQLK